MGTAKAARGGSWSGVGVTSRLARVNTEDSRSPTVVRESLVGFRHTMRVVPLLNSSAAVVGGIQQLRGKLLDHRLLIALPRVADDPAKAQRSLAVAINFDRHLVVGAPDSPRFNLERRLHVIH